MGLEVVTVRVESSLLGSSDVRGASMAASILNLANTIMGTGVLALPHALSGCGIISGTIFLFMSSSFGIISLHLLAQSAHRTGRPATFYSVCAAASPRLPFVVDLIVVLNGFLACLGFLVVATDSFSKLVIGGPGRALWTLVTLLLVAPLCLLKKMSMLQFTSLLSVVVLLFISLLIVVFSFGIDTPLLRPCANMTNPEELAKCKGPVEAFGQPLTTLQSFATFIVAFTCQQNIFSITNEVPCSPAHTLHQTCSVPFSPPYSRCRTLSVTLH